MNTQYLLNSRMEFDPQRGVATWGEDPTTVTDFEMQQLRTRCRPHTPSEQVAITVKKLVTAGKTIDEIVSAMRAIKGYSRSTVKKYYPVFNPSPK